MSTQYTSVGAHTVHECGCAHSTRVWVCTQYTSVGEHTALTLVFATFLRRSGVQESGIFQATCDTGFEAS